MRNRRETKKESAVQVTVLGEGEFRWQGMRSFWCKYDEDYSINYYVKGNFHSLECGWLVKRSFLTARIG